LPRAQVAEIQRSRLLAAAIRAVEELGYTETTVAQITSRAHVSRRTFYELFANCEECLVAVIEDVLAQVQSELATLDLEDLAWRERVRTGLWAILSFFDREPMLARLCIVYSLRGGPAVLERREEILACLARVVDEGRLESSRVADFTSLTAEGLVGAGFAILHSRLLKERSASLRGLLGELMALIVLPYQGVAAARREQARSTPNPLPGAARKFVKVARSSGDPLDGISMRLTYRTARVLQGVGENPGLSNREVAEYAGIVDQGQVSKLLGRLERLELLSRQGSGHMKGEPNAWALTRKGEFVAQGIRAHLPSGGVGGVTSSEIEKEERSQ
jgi:AcrR family transcriptional regulator